MNNIDLVPPVLFRPGRIYLKIKMGYVKSDQVIEYVKLFFYEEKHEEYIEDVAKDIAQELIERDVTIAQLQNHFSRYREDPRAALKDIQDMFCVTKES